MLRSVGRRPQDEHRVQRDLAFRLASYYDTEATLGGGGSILYRMMERNDSHRAPIPVGGNSRCS